MSKGKKRSRFWLGLIIGSVISTLTTILTISIQHWFILNEKTTQLYLDEKKDFVVACDNYLKQYRQWRELMNYMIYSKDSLTNSKKSEFNNLREATIAYHQWRKDLDFAYGKMFILSDNEFGYKTLEVSTVLHASLADLFDNNYDITTRQQKLEEVDGYFFESWLSKAQEEIFRYNSGNRKQKSLQEFIEEQRQLNKEQRSNDSLSSQMYQDLMNLYEYQSKHDTTYKLRHRMPTKEEFENFVNP